MNDSFICVICGASVSKRKSIAYKDGRACKTHSESQEQLDTKKTKQVEQIQSDVQKNKEKFSHDDRGFDFKPRCWLCHIEGISLQQFYSELLMESLKTQIKNEAMELNVNFFEQQEQIAKALASKKHVVLFTFNNLTEEQRHKLKGCNFNAQQLISMTNSVICCASCMNKAGLQYIPPEVNFDKIKKFMPVYMLAEPELKKIAEQEIQRESVLN